MITVIFFFVRCPEGFFNKLVSAWPYFYGAWMLKLVIIAFLSVFFAISFRSVRLLHSLQRVFLIYRLTRRAKNPHQLFLHFLLLSLLLQSLSLSMVIVKTCSSHGSASVDPGRLGLLLDQLFDFAHILFGLKWYHISRWWRRSSRQGPIIEIIMRPIVWLELKSTRSHTIHVGMDFFFLPR